MISVDGLRADVVRKDFTPHLFEMMQEGARAASARCAMPSLTVPNHVSMLTGLLPATHRVLENTAVEGRILKGPSIFTLVRASGRTSGLYVSKAKLGFLAQPREVDRHLATETGDSRKIVNQFVADFGNPKSQWSFSFIHLMEPDHAGHASGWMSQDYLNAVYAADRLVGRIWQAIQSAGLADETLVIVTADHGGEGLGHEADVPEVRQIPWIAIGPGIAPGTLLEGPVGPQDIAPTVLSALGLEIPTSMQGKPVATLLKSTKESKELIHSL